MIFPISLPAYDHHAYIQTRVCSKEHESDAPCARNKQIKTKKRQMLFFFKYIKRAAGLIAINRFMKIRTVQVP